MHTLARRTARRISFMGLLVALCLTLPATPALARHAKASTSIGYAAPGTGLVLPNGQDNPNAGPVIVACDPATSSGVIRTTLQLGSPGLNNSLDPSRDYAVYTIRLSAQTQIWVSGDAGKPYLIHSLCPLEEYDPSGNNDITFKDLASVTFTFPKSRHVVKNAQQLFNTATPAKVMFYVSGDINS